MSCVAVMEHVEILFVLACVFGFLMAWGVGANDVANAMGTSVGSRAITIKQAIWIAAIFEFMGALLAGGSVTKTIRGDIINPHYIDIAPYLLVDGMLASLLAAAVWLFIATRQGWPVSTTHSIVGAIIGFGVISFGFEAIYWQKVVNIVFSWLITPFIAGIIAFGFFRSVQYFVLSRDDPIHQARTVIPIYIFLVATIICLVTLTKGLKHLGLHLSFLQSAGITLGLATAFSLLGLFLIRRQRPVEDPDSHDRLQRVEQMFGILMIFTACSMAFAHGSNDVANAIGPLAAAIQILKSNAHISTHAPIPFWILMLGAVGIVFGLATYGYRVIATIGERITELKPSRGFAAELATASTVVIASGVGLPISTTQTLVGAVLGVGLARGISALNMRVIGHIFTSWLITLPAGAILSVLFFYTLRWIFGHG